MVDLNRNFLGSTLRTTSDSSFRNTSIYVQDEWSAIQSLNVVMGGRLDRSSELDDPVFSPRIAVAIEASKTLKFRVGFSTGFRAPEVFSEDLHIDTLGADQVRIRNTQGLSEERAITGKVGVDWRSSALAPRWTFDATLSRTDVNDTFVLGEILNDGDGSLFQERANAAGSLIEGVEFNLGFQPATTLRLTAGVAYYRSRYDEAEVIFDNTPDGGSTVIATRDYLEIPNWTGLAQAVWSPSERFDAFLGLKYAGALDALNNNAGTLNRTRDFWVVDLGFTRHFQIGTRHLDLSLGAKNLFDQRQRDLEAGANRDSDYVYGPRFARSFYASLRYEF